MQIIFNIKVIILHKALYYLKYRRNCNNDRELSNTQVNLQKNKVEYSEFCRLIIYVGL